MWVTSGENGLFHAFCALASMIKLAFNAKLDNVAIRATTKGA
jgi:hypothetical protein